MTWSDADISRAILGAGERIPTLLLERQLALRPELADARQGGPRRAALLEHARELLANLAEAVAVDEPALLGDYLAWIRVRILRAGPGLLVEDLAASLEQLRDVLRRELPAGMSEVTDRYVALGLAALARAPGEASSSIDESAPLGALAARYLGLLLGGERNAAVDAILETVESGVGVRDIYLRVLQPAQREIGRLWQVGRATVAQEHYCTAVTQLVMARLSSRVFETDRIGHTAVAMCVGRELHEIGLRMVADLLELDGWDTFFLGTSVPVAALIDTLVRYRADVLALSATMTHHVRGVIELVAAVRAAEACAGVRVLVGGHPFNLAPDLWRQVGADGSAADAQGAVRVAGRLAGLREPGEDAR